MHARRIVTSYALLYDRCLLGTRSLFDFLYQGVVASLEFSHPLQHTFRACLHTIQTPIHLRPTNNQQSCISHRRYLLLLWPA